MRDIFTPYIGFFNRLRVCYKTDKYFFVHAGVDPGIDFDKQDPNVMYWIRGKFLRSDFDHGRLVIHGHTPTSTQGLGTRPEVQPNRINIDTGAYHTKVLTAVCLDEANEQKPIFLSTNNVNPFTM